MFINCYVKFVNENKIVLYQFEFRGGLSINDSLHEDDLTNPYNSDSKSYLNTTIHLDFSTLQHWF